MGRKLLITGATLNFIIAVGHIAALFFLDRAFELTGMNPYMEKYAEIPVWVNYAATIVVTIIFIIMGLYGLSGARILKKCPFLKPGIALIIIVYTVRGVLGLAYEILSQEQWVGGIVFSLIALFIGICYFSGFIWRWHGKGRQKYYPTNKQ